MTDHETLIAQGRTVLMQQRAIDAVYTDGDGASVDVRMIVYQPDEARMPPGPAQEGQKAERVLVELPKSVAEGGVEDVGLKGHFTIAGVKWGIESIPTGVLGMHRVMLKKTVRVATHGRRV